MVKSQIWLITLLIILCFGALSFGSGLKRYIITETIIYHIYDLNPESNMLRNQLMYPAVLGSELQQSDFVEGTEVEHQLDATQFYYINQEVKLNVYRQYKLPWDSPVEIYDTFKEAQVIYKPSASASTDRKEMEP
jgi:hypothetical protein